MARRLAIAAVALILAGLVPGLPRGPADPIAAATPRWYDAALAWANEAGVVTQSPDRFRPGAFLNRGQEASAFWRLAGSPADAPSVTAPDVGSGAWYRPAVDWAVDRGRIPLRPDGTYDPRASVTRAAFAIVLWKAAGSPATGSASFSDVPPGSAYAAAVGWAADRGILRGFGDGTFRPASRTTRGQFVVALHRLHLAHEDDPPNFVLIMTDDQTLESMRVMPRTEALLGGDGTTYTEAIATYPLCCPSRATALTGQYAHNHGVVNNVTFAAPPNPPRGGHAALDHDNTLPVWLRAAGYATAHVGKYLNCYGSTHAHCRTNGPEVPPGWERWFGLVDPYPANYGYFEFDVFDDGALRHVGPAPDVYQTDVLADRAVADLTAFGEREQPFFLNVWPQAPHSGGGATAPGPFSPAPAPRHTGMFTTEPGPSTPAVGETDLSDKPQYVRDIAASWSGVPVADYRAMLQSLQAVDEMVERLVETLAAIGELERTVIVFTSDNGQLLGEHRLNFRKVVPHEESIRVPLLVRGPGFAAGAVADQLVGNIDVAPTFVDLAGIEAGRVMDGESLAAAPRAGRALLLEDWPNGTFVGLPPHYEGVRTADDVYLEYATGEREYYDLVSDPHQLVSGHDAPATLARRQALAAVLAGLRTCVGAACHATDPG
jgi:arylsulfatase A-like enzyme